jgi:hypothetical protein
MNTRLAATTPTYRPSACYHNEEARFVAKLIEGSYCDALYHINAAIYLRAQVIAVCFGGWTDLGHVKMIAHLERARDRLEASIVTGTTTNYKITKGIFNSVRRKLYVPHSLVLWD